MQRPLYETAKLTRRRRFEGAFFLWAMRLSVLGAGLILCLILAIIAFRGAQAPQLGDD